MVLEHQGACQAWSDHQVILGSSPNHFQIEREEGRIREGGEAVNDNAWRYAYYHISLQSSEMRVGYDMHPEAPLERLPDVCRRTGTEQSTYVGITSRQEHIASAATQQILHLLTNPTLHVRSV